jgi:hypothetical protein
VTITEYIHIGISNTGRKDPLVVFVPWAYWHRLNLELGTPAHSIRVGVMADYSGRVYVAHDGDEFSIADRVGTFRLLDPIL